MDNQHNAMAIPPLQIGAGRPSSLATSTSNGRLDQVFVQSTKVYSINLKLEWRIEKFEMLMRLTQNGKFFVSKRFAAPEAPGLVWELHCYPNGKREEDVSNASFFLRQIGLAHRDEGIRTDFYIYFITETGGHVSVCRDIKEFTAQQGRGKFQNPPALIHQALHSDGSLVLACEVEFIAPGCKMIAEEVKPNDSLMDDDDGLGSPTLSEAMADMFENELHADCSFKVGSKTIMAHKCILSQQSEVFRNMFSMGLAQESKDGVVVIEGFEAEHVKAMLEFIYTGAVNPRVLAKCPESIFAIADKYQLAPLRSYMQRFLGSIINKNNLVSVSLIADLHDAPSLKKACVRFMANNHMIVIPTPQWQELREKRADLANELLEMVLEERSTHAMDVLSPTSEGSIVEPGDRGQLTFRDVLPFRRGPAVLIGGGVGNGAVVALDPNAETPQPIRAVRRVQPVRRVRQVVVEEQQQEDNPAPPQQQPTAKRTRRNRTG